METSTAHDKPANIDLKDFPFTIIDSNEVAVTIAYKKQRSVCYLSHHAFIYYG